MQRRDGYDRIELIDLLSATIGEDTARRVVMDATETLGFGDARFTREQAFEALEQIALQPGLVGITARLAKTRFRARTMAGAVRSI